MRLSHLFFTTLRDDPADAEMASHRLLLRAGYVRQLGSGIYSLLPLGKRVNDRVEQVIREEQNAIGGQEMEMPVVHPADIWRASGRYDAIGPELTRFKDRNGRDMVLAMTHEEVVGLLLFDVIRSWRQLPQQVYHFQTKWRDEPRARGGLIRVREFVMKDAYSADRDQAGLDASYEAQYGAYVRTFERLGLETVVVAVGRRDHGWQPGSRVHGPQPGRRGRPGAVRDGPLRRQPPGRGHAQAGGRDTAEAPLPREEVATPGTTTIATLAAFLGIGADRTAKAAFFVTGDGRLVTAIVRGDYEVNETKLGQRGQGGRRHPAGHGRGDQGGRDGARLRLADRCARDTVVVIDDLVERSPNLVAGANREGFHYRNVNAGRDYTADVVADITNAQEGDAVPGLRRAGDPAQRDRGRQHLQARHQVQRRRRRQLPRRGRRRPPDRHGLVRDRGRAQHRLHRRGAPRREGDRLAGRGRAVRRPPGLDRREARSRVLTRSLSASTQIALDAGREILWDDRDESPGVKFTDAELLGMPWILTVSPRSLAAGGVEVTERATGERSTRPIEDVEAMLRGG